MDELLHEREAAELCGLAEASLRQRRFKYIRGLKPDFAPPHVPYRGGRAVRYRRADVMAWIARHPEVARRDAIERRTISQDEAAEILQIGRTWLRRLHSRGAAPPAHKAGRSVRYDVRELVAWARENDWPTAPLTSRQRRLAAAK